MVRCIFFDAGNTIVFPDYEIYRSVASSFGINVSIDEVLRAEAGARQAFDDAVANSPGDVSVFWSVYYTPFYEKLGIPPAAIPEAIDRTRAANDTGLGIWKVPVDGFSETMEEIRARDLATGIISNSDGRLEERLGEIGVRDRFDFVIDSGVVGVSKPDPRIFNQALQEASVEPSEAVFVGDYYVIDVLGARAVGMRPILFDPCGAYVDVDCDVVTRFGDILKLLDEWEAGP
jgi:putative hydrolase of the HAD superfamily